MFDTTLHAGHPPLDPDTGWLGDVRNRIGDEHCLVHRDESDVSVVPLTQEWTKIGRSLTADIRLDDPTVSRRHALICRQDDSVRVLDDRSLNGVFLNGERTEWSELEDGDEIVIGRYRIYFLGRSQANDEQSAVSLQAS
jgi:pSer/pThr/pTyr-binding forkhead associated (FHA) protein